MTRKRTRRRHYALVNPITYATEGAAITPEPALNKLRLRELAAIEAFRTGAAGRQEWLDLADMLNICETLALGGVGPEALDACEAAQEALAQAHDRYHRGGSLSLSAAGLQALRDSYEYHDLQRQSVPRGDYERAIKKTADRIRSGNPKVRVCMAEAREPA